MRNLLCLFFLFSSLLFAEPSYITFPSDTNWKQKESEHFRVIYAEGQARQGDRALIAAEKAFKTLTTVFKEYPEKTWIVLADFVESTNGYALNFPYPHMVIYTSPPEAGGQLAALDDWFDSIIFHEYTHILHLYPAHGLWKVMRTIFGSIIVPNGLLPSHFHEGMATLMETEFTKAGRGRGTIFSMFRRKAVEANLWGKDFVPLDLLEGSQTRFPTGISPYFFGYTLHKELWDRKGKEGIWDLTLSYSDNWPYLFLDGPLEGVYGVGYTKLWNEIFEKGEKEAKKEIEQIKKAPLSKLEYLTDTRHYKWDVTFSPDGKRVVTRRNSPTVKNGFEFYDLATKKSYKTINKSTGDTEGLCWVKWEGKEYLIFAMHAGPTSNYSYKHLAQLEPDSEEAYDYTEGGEDTHYHHMHKMACQSSLPNLLVYQEGGGKGVVKEIKIDPVQHTITPIKAWAIPEGSWVTSLVAGKPGWFLLRQSVSTTLYRWNEGQDPKPVLTFPFHAYNLKPGDKNELLAITSKDGRDEVWEINPDKKQIRKKIALVGGVNAFDYADEQFVLSSFEHGGFDIAVAEEVSGKWETIPTTREPKAETKTENASISEEGSYSPVKTLLPRTWVPSMLFVPDGVQFGIWVPGFDLSQRHFYDIIAAYDTRGLPYATFGYNYRFASKFALDFNAQYLPSYIQSLGSPNTRDNYVERWGSSLGVSARLWKLPRIRLAALYRKLEENVKVTASYQSVGAEIDLSDTWGFKNNKPLAVSPSNGVNAYLNYAYFPKAFGSTRDYFTAIGGLDIYLENPVWSDSVFYIGNKVGYTEGSIFYNSYFEGGGEILFSQGRNLFMNRGYLSGTFIARRMFTNNIEFRFPIARVDRGIWLYAIHLKRIHAAFTFDTLSWDFGAQTPDSVPKNYLQNFYHSAGFELRSDWKFGYYLPTLIRLGVYHGITPFERNGVRLDQPLQFVLGLEASL